LGTKEDVTREALSALKEGIDVLAPGCGIPARTPNENLLAMTEAAKKYRYKN